MIFNGRPEYIGKGIPKLYHSAINKMHYGYFINGKSKEGLCKEGLTIFKAFEANKRATQGDPKNWEVAVFDSEKETKNFFNILN